jgi:hypothetical protein
MDGGQLERRLSFVDSVQPEKEKKSFPIKAYIYG